MRSSSSALKPGRHRAPVPTLAERVAPVSGLAGPVLGGLAVGTMTIAATSALPGVANAGVDTNDGSATAPSAVTVAVRIPTGAHFASPSSTDLARLRGCESTNNYGVNTGNGFYGAYQFDLQTWESLGLEGFPSLAAPQLQDAAAMALEQSRGWEPWPQCAAHLDLVPQRAYGVPATEVFATLAPASAAGAVPVVAIKAPAAKHRSAVGTGPTAVANSAAPAYATAAPPFAGHVLSTADASTYRSDVRMWQERMVARGWSLTPDGYFGPATQAVARAFASEKGISDGFPGEVGQKVWRAAWTAPLD